MGLTRYGLREIVLSVLVWGAAGTALGVYVSPWAAAGPGAVFLFTLYFFRDPRRAPPYEGTERGERVLVSPADGRVVDIEEVEEPEFLGGRALRIGIFLSILDVHVNRSPLAGRVKLVKYTPGKFLAAFNERAATDNESNLVGIETFLHEPLRLAVKQISGIIARRIVCTCRETEDLARGERFGMIKFGSRTELYLPPGAAEISVKVGDRVRGGLTVIGEVKGRTTSATEGTESTENGGRIG